MIRVLNAGRRSYGGLKVANAPQKGSKKPTGGRVVDKYCCLMNEGTRCSILAGKSIFGVRMQKRVNVTGLKLHKDPKAMHNYVCNYHKDYIQSVCIYGQTNNVEKKPLEESGEYYEDRIQSEQICVEEYKDNCEDAIQPVYFKIRPIEHGNISNDTQVDINELPDFTQLNLATLLRYMHHFGLKASPHMNKKQLADIVKTHFKTIDVIELDTVAKFVYTVKSNLNNLDAKNYRVNSTTKFKNNRKRRLQ